MRSAVTPDHLLAWEVQLDRLDLEILRVERLIKAMAPLQEPDWVAPEAMGTMPAELLPRAREIQERQRAAELALAKALRHTGHEMTLTQRLAPARALPRFVDVSA